MDMMSPGLSVGYAAKSVPMVAKQKDVRTRPAMRAANPTIGVGNRMSPAIRGTKAMPRLYRNPLILSPRTTVCSEIGADKSRSKVFILRSMGMETGSIEDAENRIVIAISPGIITAGTSGLPIANARNIKMGKSMPETMIFGLR